MTNRETPSGLVYGLIAYGWWGLMPVYIRLLASIPAAEILAFRIVTSVAVLSGAALLFRRGPALVQLIRQPRLLAALGVSTVLVAVNWYVYTLAAATGRVVDASLGYFVQPLLNAALGAALFRERFRIWQMLALAVAGSGFAVLLLAREGFPWIACVLALTFGLYSAVRKATPVDGFLGLLVEVSLLLPAAGWYVWLQSRNGELAAAGADRTLQYLLAASGVVTAIPMICFGQAARRLRISTLGFLQYVSPSIQLGLAVFAFGEPFDAGRAAGFGLVWLALGVYTADLIAHSRLKSA